MTAGAIVLGGGTAPAQPNAGEVTLYTKGDGVLYLKDDAGAEVAVSSPPPPAPSYAFQQTWSGEFTNLFTQAEVFGDGSSLSPLLPGLGTVITDSNIKSITGLAVNVFSSALTETASFTIYVNDFPSALSLAFAAAESGVKVDTSAVSVTTADRVSFVVDAGPTATGAIRFQASLVFSTET